MGVLALLWTPISIPISRYYNIIEKEKKRKGTSIMHSSGLILFVRASVSHYEYEQWYRTSALGIPDRRPTADVRLTSVVQNITAPNFPGIITKSANPHHRHMSSSSSYRCSRNFPPVWQMSKPDRTLPYHIFLFPLYPLLSDLIRLQPLPVESVRMRPFPLI